MLTDAAAAVAAKLALNCFSIGFLLLMLFFFQSIEY